MQSARAYNNKSPSTWSESSSYRFSTEWTATPASEIASSPTQALTIITQNVLFDEFEADKLHSDYRWNELLNQLEVFNADIIGFQEVKEPFLLKLLESPWIRQDYHISCIDDSHCSPYGQVIIAKFPFKVSYYEFSSHKRVVVGTFKLNDRNVHVPVIHLTSDHGKGNLGAKRLAQMNTIYSRTVPDVADGPVADNGADAIVIGDFNMGDGGEGEALSIRPDFVDCWKQLNGNEDGYTFDPAENPLAAITTKTGVRRRYDRIIVRSPGFHWVPLSCTVITTEVVPITIGDGSQVNLTVSDHFGVMAQLQFLSDPTERSAMIAERTKFLAKEKEAALSLASFLFSEGMIETREALAHRHQALQALQTLIATACPSKDGIRLIPVGSFGLGLQTPTSDIDVLCCGSLNTGDFLSTLTRFLNAEARRSDALVQTPRLLLDAVVPVVTVVVAGVTFDVQYAQVRNVNFNRTFDLGKLLAEAETRADVRNQFDQASFLAAQSVRAVEVLSSMISDMPTFQKAYLCIKRWAEAKGLTSNRIGFLGGHAWTIMLTRVAQSNPRASIFGLVSAFFETYAEWDFRMNPVTIQVRSGIPYAHVSKKEPVCVITCSPPYKNITRNATHSTRRVLIAELQKAHSAIKLGGNPQDILHSLWTPVDFFSQHSTYLQVNFAGATYREYSQFAGQVESRLVQLLLALETSPAVLARPWPIRYVYASSAFNYGGSLFIGLSPIKENVREKEASKSGGHLDLAKFADEFIASMERWAGFSPDSMRITIRQRARDSFSPLPVPESSTTYNAAAIAAEDVESSDEEDVEEDSPAEASSSEAPSSSAPAPASSSAASSSSSKNDKKVAASSSTANPSKGGKKNRGQAEAAEAPKRRMKTSEECINWIKHDGRFNPEEFIISYEDRFVGLMEVALADFSSEQTSDVFIPMHRVWLIKQNGVIVWDRKNRIDNVGAEFRGPQ